MAPLRRLTNQQYVNTLRDLLGGVTAIPGGVDKPAPCAAGTDESACGDAFIRQFGKRAWRRPLAADEATRLATLFRAQRAASGYATAVAVTLQAMLMAPQFV